MPHRRKDSPFWWISYTDASGQRIRESSGITDHKEAKALESKAKLNAHQQKKWGAEPERTFDELALQYLTATSSKKSHDRDLMSAKQLYRFFSGKVLIHITPQHISDYKTARQKAGIKDGTIIKELRLFSSAINHARREWGWRIENVVSGRVPKKPPSKLRWLTRAEYDALLVAARQSKVPHLHDFIVLAVNTGMRRGEMLHLEWSRVDLEQRLVYLQPDDAKGGTFQSVPLNREALAVLKARKEGGHARWVYHNTENDDGRLQSVKKAFAVAVRRAGLSDVTPHTLRHTCGSWLAQAGIPIRTISEILRHKDIRTTLVYAHLAPDSARVGVAALERDLNVTGTGIIERNDANSSNQGEPQGM